MVIEMRKIRVLYGVMCAAALTLAVPVLASPPSDFQEGVVGTLDEAGTTTVSGTKWTLEGAVGTDVAGTEDNLYFVYKTLTGNGSVSARQLAKYEGGSPNSGVMIRASLEPNAPFSSLLFTTSTLSWKRRLEADAAIVRTDFGAEYSWPKYMRLQRTGNDVTGFVSEDGKIWRQLTTPITLPMGNTALFGLAMASRNGSPSTVEFDSVQVQEGVVSVGGIESAATDNMVLIAWQPIASANLVGYNIYRGAKGATLDKMTLLTTTPQTDTFYFDNKASDTPLRSLSYVVAPVFKGTPNFEGPAVRAR
jgi:hypothetical protein